MSDSSKWELTKYQQARFIDALTSELAPLRAKVGISQGDLSTLIGVSRQTYSAIECGKRKMSWNTYLSLVLFYDYNKATHQMLRNMNAFPVELVRNFNDGDTLQASCDYYPFPAELNVYRFADGNTYAFLPAEYVFVPAAPCNLTLTLSDGSSQTLRINLREGKEPTAAKQDYMVSDTNLQSVFTEVGFTELESTIAQKTASTNPTPLWDGKFVYPDAANKGTVGKGMAGYGTYRNVKSLYQREYFHYGLDIAMNEGDAVYAANNGKVVFAGNLALTGNTVIIDHGCSLFTYYYHLSSLSVAEGDAVSKSGVIGAAGSTGFAVKAGTATFDAAPQVHFAASLNGKYINPYYLWKYDISYPA